MITQWSAWFRTTRRWLSRNEWAVWLLRLPKARGAEVEPGLVMIQIDGLSQKQLEKAINEKRMPFLKRLLQTEGYHLHTFYSGLPSSTPAVQGELFYGKKCATPAFSFREHETGQVVRMYHRDPAARVERRLDDGENGLLAEGSAYSDNYTGAADEAHFCASTVGWGGVLKAANPLTLAWVLLWYSWSLVRVASLMTIEFFLAMIDCCRGLIAGRDLWKELMLVPGRVAVGILLRELVTIGACIDVARGVPIVHMNFLGYDEQAHRRGPSSAFAHWSLRGIDRAIKKIWRAARRSNRRDYDVWVYSDHGQDETRQYHKEFGRTIQDAVADVFGNHYRQPPDDESPSAGNHWPSRAMWLGSGRVASWLARNGNPDGQAEPLEATVVGMGPVAHIYTDRSLSTEEKETLARKLVDQANIPAVLVADQPGTAYAYTSQGRYQLPQQTAELLGEDYPFLADIDRDLVRLVHHDDAGQFVLLGWRKGCRAITYRVENGSHAGAGVEETRAFALLPFDAPLPIVQNDYIRPLDMRRAALHLLGREELDEPSRIVARDPDRQTLRIATYNVHHCIGMDGKLSPARIARVIALCDADVVALQELDVGRSRSGDIDQAHAIARRLEMEFHYHPAWQIEEESFGNAVFSRYPMRLVHHDQLPGISQPRGLKPKGFFQPRGAMWVELSVNHRKVQLINTHLGLFGSERWLQVEALLGPDWLDHPKCHEPAILCGDFNAGPKTKEVKHLCRTLRDAQIELEDHGPLSTWFGPRPLRRIDHVFFGPGLSVTHIEVPQTELARVASDHLPLVVEMSLEPLGEGKPASHGEEHLASDLRRNK